MKSICLSMIVKNEEKCIVKCLESVKPFISYWIICDTGSTDNTEEVIKDYLKDIPGELHKHEWVDFSTNRNKALELARNKAEFILIIDADDRLIVHDKSIFDNLSPKVYQVEILYGSIAYHRRQLIHNSIPAKYVSILHEYLDVPLDAPHEVLKSCNMVVSNDGSRSRDPEKYLKDALLLEKALLSEPNNDRYVFYAAQSYRDAGVIDKAIELYRKRYHMGGWIEERFISQLEVGKMLDRKKAPISEIEDAYIKAYLCNKNRAESLCYLCIACRHRELLHKSYFYGKVGLQIKKPAEALFLEPACYDWRLHDEVSVASYYVGSKQESAELIKQMLNSGCVPECEMQRILKNLEFCFK